MCSPSREWGWSVSDLAVIHNLPDRELISGPSSVVDGDLPVLLLLTILDRTLTHPSSRVKAAEKYGIEQATGETEFFGLIAFASTTPLVTSIFADKF